jgi:hypothetical protein
MLNESSSDNNRKGTNVSGAGLYQVIPLAFVLSFCGSIGISSIERQSLSRSVKIGAERVRPHECCARLKGPTQHGLGSGADHSARTERSAVPSRNRRRPIQDLKLVPQGEYLKLRCGTD